MSPLHGVCPALPGDALLHEGARGLAGTPSEICPLFLEPPLELRHVGQVQRAEEVTAVERERALGVASVERRREGARIAPQEPFVHRELLVSSRDQHVPPQRGSQLVDGLA